MLQLEIICGLPQGLAFTGTENNAQILLSETLTRGTGCLNWARPGLWGFRVGNRPVLPGYRCDTEEEFHTEDTEGRHGGHGGIY